VAASTVQSTTSFATEENTKMTHSTMCNVVDILVWVKARFVSAHLFLRMLGILSEPIQPPPKIL